MVCFAAAPEPVFEAQTIDGKIQIGYGVAVGEVDGDGRPDVLVVDAKQVVWYRNPGASGLAWDKHVMAENLTQRDHVCIAARDIDGDGKVEVAVGAQWNPGNTSDPAQSGAVFYLIRPEDPTQKWEPVQITPHEPTVHRMHWVRVGEKKHQLAVLPLHGVDNRGGQGKTVNLLIYDVPADPKGEWKLTRVDTGLHATHNFDAEYNELHGMSIVQVGGAEGVVTMHAKADGLAPATGKLEPMGRATGEVRMGVESLRWAAIEPMHGNAVVAWMVGEHELEVVPTTLDASLAQGHALAVGDLLGVGRLQIVAGWREKNAQGKVGIRMYVPLDEKGEKWATHTIDDNTMACEDLKVADLDGDGRLDIVASGRATKNVVVYWNRTKVEARDE